MKENLLYIGTYLKGYNLLVSTDPAREPDGVLIGVPKGEGALTHDCATRKSELTSKGTVSRFLMTRAESQF